jgi:hypothetical protein
VRRIVGIVPGPNPCFAGTNRNAVKYFSTLAARGGRRSARDDKKSVLHKPLDSCRFDCALCFGHRIPRRRWRRSKVWQFAWGVCPSAESCPASRVSGQRLDACGIDDYEARAKLGHAAKVADVERQQVRNCVCVADSDKSGVMDLLPDNPYASHYALPSWIDIQCVDDERKSHLEARC